MSSGSSSGSGHATVNGTYNSVEEGLADIQSSLSNTESTHKLVSNVVKWAELRAAALESQAGEMDRFYIWHTFWL